MFLLTTQVFQYLTPCPMSGSDISKQRSAFIITAKPSNNIPVYLLLENEGNILRNAGNSSQNVTVSRSENFNFQERFYSSRRLPRDTLSLIWDLLSFL